AADQALVSQLTAAQAKATGPKKDAIDSQLEQAKAQLELDQDEVDDAKQDLMEAGGEPQARLPAMGPGPEASSPSSDTTKINRSPPTEGRGLINRVHEGGALHQKDMEWWRQKKRAEPPAAVFAARHEATAQQARNEKVLEPPVAGIAPSSSPAATSP